MLNAFDQLHAEGYVRDRVGSGTYVSPELPDATPGMPDRSTMKTVDARRLAASRRGTELARLRVSISSHEMPVRPFRPGVPALDAFPVRLWSRLVARRWRRVGTRSLGYGDTCGYGPLREAIAAYLATTRAVHCTPDQVIVVSGSMQTLDLAARVLLDPGDAIWFEDPGYHGAYAALVAAGADVVRARVDDEGLDVSWARRRYPKAKAAYVTPTHQYPLGVTMSLSRRLALLQWASEENACVIEDDYDSEFRFSARPIAALQGLDLERRVIYTGTFSKVLFPSLRIGYLVVPPHLIEPFARVRALTDRHSPLVEQAVLTDFIVDGHLARHVRRMRELYSERQDALVAAVSRKLAGLLDARASGSGLHLSAMLRPGVDDVRASDAALARGVEAPALSSYYGGRPRRRGLVLGYACVPPRRIRTAVDRLAEALDPHS